jgi:hypothetical protein
MRRLLMKIGKFYQKNLYHAGAKTEHRMQHKTQNRINNQNSDPTQ